MKIDEFRYRDEITDAPLIPEFRRSPMDPTIKTATGLLPLDRVQVAFRPWFRKKLDDRAHSPNLDVVNIVVSDQMKEAITSSDAKLLESLLFEAIREQRACRTGCMVTPRS